MTPSPTADPGSLLDQIPTPDVIVRRLGESTAERRLLRALLKVAKLRQQLAPPSAGSPDARHKAGYDRVTSDHTTAPQPEAALAD